ncbi:response regulator [Algiphilus sp.]|uniref:response regulator n=1 Tax=Algiphilus sp. TaxID=1872431 RepID=UPI003B52683B
MNAAPPARRSALIVTSEPALLQCLRFIVHGMGLGVSCADNVIAAQAQVAATHPVLVLIDLDALGARGFALCRNLSGMAAASRKPMHQVVLSLRSTAASEAKALAMGAQAVLQKPFDPMALRQQLMRILAET